MDDTGPDTVLCEFEENVAYVDDRYEIAVPWKKGKVDKLMNNEIQACTRLTNLTHKLSRTRPA